MPAAGDVRDPPPADWKRFAATVTHVSQIRTGDYFLGCHFAQPLTEEQMLPFLAQPTPGPRGAQAIVLAAKLRAILDGRYNVAREDIRAVVPMALRHRLILNFEGQAENVLPDQVLKKLYYANALRLTPGRLHVGFSD